jgi:hypothetical protein
VPPDPVIRDIGGIPVAFLRKRVRYLRLTVCPPDGEVRVSVPWHVSDSEALAFVAARAGWMRERIDAMRRMPRPAPPRFDTGGTVRIFGEDVPLRILETEAPGPPRIEDATLVLPVRPGATEAERRVVFAVWLRARLSETLSRLVAHWTAVLGEPPVRWDMRRMKTRWGSCAARKRFLRFNLALAEVPVPCIEYVVVHELTHLAVQNHSPSFWSLVSSRLPGWRALRTALNRPQTPFP